MLIKRALSRWKYLYCRFITAEFKRRGKSREFLSGKRIRSSDNCVISKFSPHSVFTSVIFVAHTLHIVSALKQDFPSWFQIWKLLLCSSRISSSSLLSLPRVSFWVLKKQLIKIHQQIYLRSIRCRTSDSEDFVYVIIEKHKVPLIKNKHTQSENIQ